MNQRQPRKAAKALKFWRLDVTVFLRGSDARVDRLLEEIADFCADQEGIEFSSSRACLANPETGDPLPKKKKVARR